MEFSKLLNSKTETFLKFKIKNKQMGVKHFFSWFRRQFPGQVRTYLHRRDSSIDVLVHTLLLDLNGIFHTKAAEVYQYGPNKRPSSLLGRAPQQQPPTLKLQLKLFSEICRTIEQIVDVVRPIDKIVLCIDGVAPQSKQSQQRGRRFRAANERSEEDFARFDSNCITPGTKFLDNLSKYIDWWIKQKVSSEWSHLEVVFSGEKVPGEGEHKLITYLRKYSRQSETYCVYGVDADLIMLSLGTMLPNFFLIRENMHANNEYFVVDVGQSRHQLVSKMSWEANMDQFDEVSCIYDFIFLCFATGNDFLPHVPSIEIIDGGIETMISAYRAVGAECGHLTEKRAGTIFFRLGSLKKFFEYIASKENEIMEWKLNKKHSYFPDTLLESCSNIHASSGQAVLDFDRYHAEWSREKFGDRVEKVCTDYLDGLHWVINYYIMGVPTWTWLFEHHYAPFARSILKVIDGYSFKPFSKTQPHPPFMQLMSVLPPKSRALLPPVLGDVLVDKSLSIAKYYPDKIEVDLVGKQQEWEGVVIVPFMNTTELRSVYYSLIRRVAPADLRRNVVGSTLSYKNGPSRLFSSFYGDVQVCCDTTTVDL
jgi:5'-3' exonuclease